MTTALLITTYNRGQLLRHSLERLTRLTLPDEVLVVDDGSTDDTEAITLSFKDRLPIRYIYNHSPNHTICSMARNIGIKNTTSDLIITSEPELFWVTDIIPLLHEERKEHPDEIISASIIYHAQANTKINESFYDDPREALKGHIVEDYQIEPRSYNPNGFCKTVNMQATFLASYERKWLMEVNGWDEEFPGCWGWDDIDLCTRLRINGINQHISTKLEAIHQWHPHVPPHVMGEASLQNEKHMKDKRLDEAKKGASILKANQNREWGVIMPR